MSEIVNAKITSTHLGTEDHGIFTCYLTIEWPGAGCSFGGYALDQYDASTKARIGTAYGMEFIRLAMAAVGVSRWEKLPGTYCRVETEGWGGGLTRIGHITEDRWFDPKEDLGPLSSVVTS